jgi:hypothetical protein
MKRFKIVVFAALAMVSSVSVQAAVVISNMGANGLTDSSSNLSSDNTNTVWHATGFTTGSVAQNLDWVSLVVSNNEALTGSPTKTVDLFSDNAGSPGSSLGSSVSTSVGFKGVYTFNFGPGTNLAANTSYWILPDVGLKWYRATADADPTAQNSSGFIYAGADKRSVDSGLTWEDRTQNYTVSIATVPVPEPQTVALLGAGGAAMAAGLLRRRRAGRR